MGEVIKTIAGADGGTSTNGRVVIRTGRGQSQTLDRNSTTFSHANHDSNSNGPNLDDRVDDSVDQLVPAGYEQNTSLSTAQSLTVPTGAESALIQAVTQNVRWRDDGTSPTASIGMQIEAGKSIYYVGDLSAFEVIEETASAEINITYYEG